MFKPVARILLKLFELIGCVACVITKVLTDQKARRVALRNQKFSMEWSLLTNVTWSREGNAFANVTYGGYTLITALLLIGRIINSRSRPTSTEKIFLTVGMLFFIAMGGLVFASIEQVPPDLHENAIILGSLSFFIALLFLIDLADPMARYTSNHTQTDHISNAQSSTQTQSQSTEFKQLNIPNLKVDTTPLPSPEHEGVPPNGYYFSGDQVDIVQTRIAPSPQHPVFAKVLMPEKKRPFRKLINEPQKLVDLEETYSKASTCYDSGTLRKEYNTSDENNLDRFVHTGFVANAARMWDRRARRGGRSELTTIV